ncbi:divalent-cation tolerance protein CutA [Lusitaniella coriacea]|uniref:divalent-cation tolerance protein CutA n=1 Tax=Lusitaniella coriacea TaxID=1983105 RepID=UPI003CE9B802
MDENSQNYGIVLTTVSSQSEGRAIASALIEAHLAACVSMMPVHSIYTWQGQVNSDQEWQLAIKTNLALFDPLSAKIKELHSYELPEIIALPIVAGFPPYLNWIAENTKQNIQ